MTRIFSEADNNRKKDELPLIVERRRSMGPTQARLKKINVADDDLLYESMCNDDQEFD
eukprot:CAMPEP_0116899256 /NCGR_PEP_ID=MMETSP0467-20121206/7869_1 /TAXON_ID=283647 /ORGANISM="Mesodinium pulex, Strain SPMC105" /LENGTH=57 /DNA_ID=CAMNT_0004571983 /DNA_START=808 /DNA_END=981 /DNA_ORIENTATION=+